MHNLGKLTVFPTSPVYEANQGVYDRNIMVVSRTQWVNDADMSAMRAGMQRISAEVGLILTFFEAPQLFELSEISKSRGYPEAFLLDTDLGYGPQINSLLLSSVLREQNAAQTKPVLECVLIAADLASPEMSSPDWVYGVSSYPVHIISTARWGFDRDPVARRQALEIVGAHELCHSYDLVNREVNMGKDALEASHCMGEVGPCIMEQVEIWKKTLSQMMAEAQNRVKWLCSDCSQEMSLKLTAYRERWLHI